MFVSLLVCYLFCTMIIAIQSEGYTCFPMRSLNTMKDTIKKSCSRQEGESVRRESLHLPVCVCVVVALTTSSEVLVKVSMYVA